MRGLYFLAVVFLRSIVRVFYDTKRDFIFRGSYLCEKYMIIPHPLIFREMLDLRVFLHFCFRFFFLLALIWYQESSPSQYNCISIMSLISN